jgi:hypothetical protein
MNPEEASAQVISTKTDAAEAIEKSRIAQNETLINEVVDRVLKGLGKVFTDDPTKESDYMTVIHSKIPVLCVRMNSLDAKIDKIEANTTWGIRIIVGAVILALLKLVIL